MILRVSLLLLALLPGAVMAQTFNFPRYGTRAPGDNSDYAATTAFVQAALATRLPLAGGTLTGGLFGTGTSAQTPNFGFYYAPGGSTRTIMHMLSKGSLNSPSADLSALDVAVKYSSGAGDGANNNPVSYRAAYKTSTATNARVQAYLGEAIDTVGGTTTFVEGGRFHGIVSGGSQGSAYGILSLAQTLPNTDSAYVIGSESEVLREDGAAAPSAKDFVNTKFAAAYLATARHGDKPDAGFMVNPFNFIPFRTGFLVAPNSTDADGFASSAVLTESAFANYGSASVGLSAGATTYAAILLLNGSSSIVRAKNGAGTADHAILAYDANNALQLGTQASYIVANQGMVFKPMALQSSPIEGQCTWNSATHKLNCWDGSVWQSAW
jgi:hypothetical protein